MDLGGGGKECVNMCVCVLMCTRCVAELYFRLEKLRSWSGQHQQSLAGFEKIRTVGKGMHVYVFQSPVSVWFDQTGCGMLELDFMLILLLTSALAD